MTECDNSHCLAAAVMPVLGDNDERLGFACCKGCASVVSGKQTTLN